MSLEDEFSNFKNKACTPSSVNKIKRQLKIILWNSKTDSILTAASSGPDWAESSISDPDFPFKLREQ